MNRRHFIGLCLTGAILISVCAIVMSLIVLVKAAITGELTAYPKAALVIGLFVLLFAALGGFHAWLLRRLVRDGDLRAGRPVD